MSSAPLGLVRDSLSEPSALIRLLRSAGPREWFARRESDGPTLSCGHDRALHSAVSTILPSLTDVVASIRSADATEAARFIGRAGECVSDWHRGSCVHVSEDDSLQLCPCVRWVVVGAFEAAHKAGGGIRAAALTVATTALLHLRGVELWMALVEIDSCDLAQTGATSFAHFFDHILAGEQRGLVAAHLAKEAEETAWRRSLEPCMESDVSALSVSGPASAPAPAPASAPASAPAGARTSPPDWLGRPTLCLCDVDDTALPTLKDSGFPKQPKLTGGTPYPGCTELLAAVRRGSSASPSGSVVFVSARPSMLGPSTVRLLGRSGLAPATVRTGSIFDMVSLKAMAARKVANTMQAAALAPQARVLLLGDSGQADVEWHADAAAEEMLAGGRLALSLIHDISLPSQRPATPPGDREAAMKGPAATYIFDSHCEAALVAWQAGLVSLEGLMAVASAASSALRSLALAAGVGEDMARRQAATDVADFLVAWARSALQPAAHAVFRLDPAPAAASGPSARDEGSPRFLLAPGAIRSRERGLAIPLLDLPAPDRIQATLRAAEEAAAAVSWSAGMRAMSALECDAVLRGRGEGASLPPYYCGIPAGEDDEEPHAWLRARMSEFQVALARTVVAVTRVFGAASS